MGNIVLIVGGARSGKSSYAEKLAEKNGKELLYLATGEAKDEEMTDRIKKHKKRRKGVWKLIEEPINLSKAISKVSEETEVVLLDCVTLWVSNMLLAGRKDIEMKNELRKVMNSLNKAKFMTIIVSNEVGSGIVPLDNLSRRYRDILGKVNQIIALQADSVCMMCCGIANLIKGEINE